MIYAYRRCLQRLLVAGLLCSSALHASGQQKIDSDTSAEQTLFRLANDERKTAGVPLLEWDEQLADAARVHALQLAEHKKLSHEFDGEEPLTSRVARQGVRFDSVAENVAFADSAEEAHEGFMGSAGHRANLLRARYNTAGIGAVRLPGGALYVAQDFAHRVTQYSGSQVEALVFQELNRERTQARLSTLVRESKPELRDEACNGHATANSVAATHPGTGHIVVFTGSEPNDLPALMRHTARQGYGAVALGACYPPIAKYTFASFTVVAIFY